MPHAVGTAASELAILPIIIHRIRVLGVKIAELGAETMEAITMKPQCRQKIQTIVQNQL